MKDSIVAAFRRVFEPLLPESDALTGPLSRLTEAGQAIPRTIAAGMAGAAPVQIPDRLIQLVEFKARQEAYSAGVRASLIQDLPAARARQATVGTAAAVPPGLTLPPVAPAFPRAPLITGITAPLPVAPVQPPVPPSAPRRPTRVTVGQGDETGEDGGPGTIVVNIDSLVINANDEEGGERAAEAFMEFIGEQGRAAVQQWDSPREL